MATAASRQALIWLATVATLAGGVRIVRLHNERMAAAVGRPSAADSTSSEALEHQLEASDSSADVGKRHSKRQRATVRSPEPPPPPPQLQDPSPQAPLDLDRASAAEIDALPGIGPSLAARIVADRDQHGAFGSIAALCDVRGIGDRLAAQLVPLVGFSGAPRDTAGRDPRRHRKAPCV